MFEDISKNLVCRNLSAGDFSKMAETFTEVFTKNVATQVGVKAVKDTGDTDVGLEKRFVMSGGGDDDIIFVEGGDVR